MSWPHNWTQPVIPNMHSLLPSHPLDPYSPLQFQEMTAQQQYAMQQNWQQWHNYQQQYAQWQAQYGEQYQRELQQKLGQTSPEFLISAPLPPLTQPAPPPPPPDTDNRLIHSTIDRKKNEEESIFRDHNTSISIQRDFKICQSTENDLKYNDFNDEVKKHTDSTASYTDTPAMIQANSLLNAETQFMSEKSTEEIDFDQQFQKWENEFLNWKRQNLNHPDRKAYIEYEEKMDQCRMKLLERREQMRRRKLEKYLITIQNKTSGLTPNLSLNTCEITSKIWNQDKKNYLNKISNESSTIPGLDLISNKDYKALTIHMNTNNQHILQNENKNQSGICDPTMPENASNRSNYNEISKEINNILSNPSLVSTIANIHSTDAVTTMDKSPYSSVKTDEQTSPLDIVINKKSNDLRSFCVIKENNIVETQNLSKPYTITDQHTTNYQPNLKYDLANTSPEDEAILYQYGNEDQLIYNTSTHNLKSTAFVRNGASSNSNLSKLTLQNKGSSSKVISDKYAEPLTDVSDNASEFIPTKIIDYGKKPKTDSNMLTTRKLVDYEHNNISTINNFIFLPTRTFDYEHSSHKQENTKKKIFKNMLSRYNTNRKEKLRNKSIPNQNILPDINENWKTVYPHNKFQLIKSNRESRRLPTKRSKRHKPHVINAHSLIDNMDTSAEGNTNLTMTSEENETSNIETDMFNGNSDKIKNKPDNVINIDNILLEPGRKHRPEKIVIIMRGLPGSGKTYLAKLIKDKEAEMAGSAVRILNIDDYFMSEADDIFICPDTGRKILTKKMVYEYDKNMEDTYMQYLLKSFKKTLKDGLFDFIIVDCVNATLKYYTQIYNFAKSLAFTPYTCELQESVEICFQKNIHGRSKSDIQQIINNWSKTPEHYLKLDCSKLIQ